MRITILLLLLTLRASALSLTNTINGHVIVSWQAPTNQLTADTIFRIYETTNLNLPLAQWNLLTNTAATNFVPYQVMPQGDKNGTNWMATNLSVTLSVDVAQDFFAGTASNSFWGESALSDYASTPPAPPSIDKSLTIQKAP